MVKIALKIGLMILLSVSGVGAAFSGAFTVEEASKRDNSDAWQGLQRLKSPAWELSEMSVEYDPFYQLFRTKSDCIADMAARIQSQVASECHSVKPHTNAKDFWSVLIFSDPSNSKLYSEIRFANHNKCIDAAMFVKLDQQAQYGALCVNFETKGPPGTARAEIPSVYEGTVGGWKIEGRFLGNGISCSATVIGKLGKLIVSRVFIRDSWQSMVNTQYRVAVIPDSQAEGILKSRYLNNNGKRVSEIGGSQDVLQEFNRCIEAGMLKDGGE